MECTAIILRSDPYKEFDRVVTVFTREYGILRLIAKGSQKIVSKNAVALEPATISIIGIAEGKELSYITSAQADVHMSQIRTDILKSVATLYVLHFLARTLKEHDPHESLWYDLVGWLQMLNTTVPFQLRCVDACVLRIMVQLGFAPDLSGYGVAFSISDGSLVDTATARSLLLGRQEVIPITKEAVEVMHTWLHADWPTIFAKVIDMSAAVAVHRTVYAYTMYHLERDIADWEKIIYSYE
jgi:DNA repair protein RecO (recombination protein O)